MTDPLWEEFERMPGTPTAIEDMSRVLVEPNERAFDQIMYMQIEAHDRFAREDRATAAEYWRFVVRGWIKRGLSEEDARELREDVRKAVNRDNGIR